MIVQCFQMAFWPDGGPFPCLVLVMNGAVDTFHLKSQVGLGRVQGPA